MPPFLDDIILNNSIGNYLISLAIVIGVYFLRKIISRSGAIMAARTVASKQNPFNRMRFKDLVVGPLETFLMLVITILAFDRLNYPLNTDISIFNVKLKSIIESIGKAAVILTFIWLSNRVMRYLSELLQEKAAITPDKSDDQLIIFFRDFFKVIFWIIGILMLIKFAFGYNLGNLLTGLSIVGAALALAFRESLENLIASFIIFFDKPFTTGDVVKVEQVTGTIEKIGLRSTRIRTTDKAYTTVPNKKMVDNIIENQTLRLQRHVATKLEIDLNAPANDIAKLIVAIETHFTTIENAVDYNIYLADTGVTAHIVQIDYFVSMQIDGKAFLKLRQAINLRLIELIDEHKLKIAAATTTNIKVAVKD